MAGIAHAVPAPVDGIAMLGTEIACAVVAVFASTAANQASPFASARRIAIAITTGDVTVITTGATVDRRRGAGEHPALFLSRATLLAQTQSLSQAAECLADASQL